MQLITRGTNNTIIFTLKEKQTLTNPYFLFELKYRGDGTTVKTFIVSDNSIYSDRYNQFLVTEVNAGSEILTSGTVNLQNVGEWHYRIFEQTSSSNLQVANTISQLENGIIMVLPSGSSTSYTHQISDNSYTYNPS
jgi:hypothetical protein